MTLGYAIASPRLWPSTVSQVHQKRVEPAAAGRREDAELLRRLMIGYQSGDPEATTDLIRRLSPMLLRFLSGPMQTRSQADDMLQECWLRVHRARHTFRPENPLLPWVYAIARHTRIDVYRRRSQIESREYGSEDLEASSSKVAEQPSIDRFDIWRLVAQLPQSQQEVVRMLKVTGMSLEEVAGATGSTVGSVKQKAHRAYRKLRTLLEESGGGPAR